MNIHELIEEQTELYAALKAEAIQINTAKELNRAAGTVVSAYCKPYSDGDTIPRAPILVVGIQ